MKPKSVRPVVSHEKKEAIVQEARKKRSEEKDRIEVSFAYCHGCHRSVSGSFSDALRFQRSHRIMCRPR